jgi:hypothetical protein
MWGAITTEFFAIFLCGESLQRLFLYVCIVYCAGASFFFLGRDSMSAPALTYNTSLETLLNEYAITLGGLRVTAGAEALRAEFELFGETLLASSIQDYRLYLDVLVGNVIVRLRDDELDEVADLVLEAILAETKGSYSAPLYKLFAGEDRPSVFKRPILGKQLERMLAWPASIEQSPETLRSLQGAVQDAVSRADSAVKSRDQAQEERSRFRVLGDRKKLIDDFMAIRQRVFDGLVSLAKEKGESEPQAFARAFFSVRPTQSKIEAETQLAQLQAQREEQVKLLAETESEINRLAQEIEAKRIEEEEQERVRAELAAAEEALAQARKKVAALKGRKR